MPERMINLFFDLVKIDSESGHEKKVIQFIQKYLMNHFTVDCTIDKYGNLIAKFPAKNSSKNQPILFSTHADTVKPGKSINPVLKFGTITSVGETILGADDKAGIAEFIAALHCSEKHPPLEFIVTREEEVGLLGAKNLNYSMIESKFGFLLDGDKLEDIIIGGPTYISMDVEVIGRSAHAGMEPEKGISAIQAAARAITRLRLGRLDKETTANIGTITGGLVRNSIPEKTIFSAECRSLTHQKALDLAEGMKSIIFSEISQIRANVNFKVDVLCEAVQIPETSFVVNIAKKAIESLDYDAITKIITGFTDASIYNNKGIETAVLGIGVQNEHSTDEKIEVLDMQRAVKMISAIFNLCA